MAEDCEKRIHMMQKECTQRVEAAASKAEHRSALILLGSFAMSCLALSTGRH